MAIAIGDIHGCLETLQRLIQTLPEEKHLVFLGDYIDRGPESASVIAYLSDLAQERACTFLIGNHESMMLKAIDSESAINQWLLNGGIATLKSYGISPSSWKKSLNRHEFMGKHRFFFQNLDPYLEMDGHIFVHAGLDMSIRKMERQSEEVLLWTREKFFKSGRRWEGSPIIFGHTPTRLMGLRGKNIFNHENLFGIDTGCVYGGYLTALDSDSGKLFQEKSNFKIDA